MSESQVAVPAPPEAAAPPPYSRDASEVTAELGSDATNGLSTAEAASRLGSYGPNAIAAEKPPSMLAVAALQLRDPMNLMLVAVTVVSFLIGEVSTGVIVALLIVLNVVLGSRQELKARASVDALSNLQVPQAKVLRDGERGPGARRSTWCPATSSSSRRATSSRPTAGSCARRRWRPRRRRSPGRARRCAKDAASCPPGTSRLGDRTNMLFQNTSVTRGTGAMVVTATGMQTQMGQIATMLSSVTRTRSPLQRELDSLTKVLGLIAWGAVAFIVVVGLIRGMELAASCCCWARRWRSRRSRPACRPSSPACCRWGPSSSPRPRPW